MALPDDLKDYRADNGFALLNEVECGLFLICVVVVAALAERMGWL